MEKKTNEQHLASQIQSTTERNNALEMKLEEVEQQIIHQEMLIQMYNEVIQDINTKYGIDLEKEFLKK